MSRVGAAHGMHEVIAAVRVTPNATASANAATPSTSFAELLKSMSAAQQSAMPGRNGKGAKSNQQKDAEDTNVAVEADATTSSADAGTASVAKAASRDQAGAEGAKDGDAATDVDAVSVKDTKSYVLVNTAVVDANVLLSEAASVPAKIAAKETGTGGAASKAKQVKHDGASVTSQTAGEAATQDAPVQQAAVTSVVQQEKAAAAVALNTTGVLHRSAAVQDKAAKTSQVAAGAPTDDKNGSAAEVQTASQDSTQPVVVKADQSIHAEATTAMATVPSAGVSHAVDAMAGSAGAGVVMPVHNQAQMGTIAPAKSETAAVSGTTAHANDDWTVQSYEAPTSNKIEIGVSGGSWGWLKVRAELVDGGGVHAYLRGTSAGAESDLKLQATDLQAYLQGQQVSVEGVHVESSRGQAWSSDANGFGGNNAGGGRDSSGQQASDRNYGAGKNTSSSQDASSTFLPQMAMSGAGGWLNVLA